MLRPREPELPDPTIHMEANMQSGRVYGKAETPPKKRPRHYSYDESVDEPARLLEQEPVEIEQETPLEDTEPVEGVESDDRDIPEFEERGCLRALKTSAF